MGAGLLQGMPTVCFLPVLAAETDTALKANTASEVTVWIYQMMNVSEIVTVLSPGVYQVCIAQPSFVNKGSAWTSHWESRNAAPAIRIVPPSIVSRHPALDTGATAARGCTTTSITT